jgi:ribosomal protein L7/L12
MTNHPLWLRVTKDFSKEEHNILLEIMVEQYGLKEDLMNINILEIIAARNVSDINDELTEKILGLLKEGKKIEAIKKYRQSYGVCLKDAKEAVEDLDDKHNPIF